MHTADHFFQPAFVRMPHARHAREWGASCCACAHDPHTRQQQQAIRNFFTLDSQQQPQVDKGVPNDVCDRLLGIGRNAARFQLGLVALRNPSPEDGPIASQEVATEREMAFFDRWRQQLEWEGIDTSKVTKDCLGLEALIAKLVSIQVRAFALMAG